MACATVDWSSAFLRRCSPLPPACWLSPHLQRRNPAPRSKYPLLPAASAFPAARRPRSRRRRTPLRRHPPVPTPSRATPLPPKPSPLLPALPWRAFHPVKDWPGADQPPPRPPRAPRPPRRALPPLRRQRRRGSRHAQGECWRRHRLTPGRRGRSPLPATSLPSEEECSCCPQPSVS